MKNRSHNVLATLPNEEAERFQQFLDAHDFSANSRRAFILDLRKFASWFMQANKEHLPGRQDHHQGHNRFQGQSRREQGQAVATVNRALVTLGATWAGLPNKASSVRTPLNPSRSFVANNSHQRAWNVPSFVACCVRLNCVRTSGPQPSSP